MSEHEPEDGPICCTRNQVMVVFGVVLAAFVLQGFLLGHYIEEAGDLAAQNKARITEIGALRSSSVDQARATDVAICQTFNRGLRAERRTLITQPGRTADTLRMLNVPEYQVRRYLTRARRFSREEVRRRPLIKRGNCKALPNPKVPKKKKRAAG